MCVCGGGSVYVSICGWMCMYVSVYVSTFGWMCRDVCVHECMHEWGGVGWEDVCEIRCSRVLMR